MMVAPPTPGSSGFASAEGVTPLRTAAGPLDGQPHQAERTVRMEYAYEHAEGQSVGRWVARLTEFLRATTARSAGFQGRFLEGLGLTVTPGNGSTTYPQDTLTQPYLQQQLQQAPAAMSSTRMQPQQSPAALPPTRLLPSQTLGFSPPEELPPPPPAFPRAPSTPAQRRLFSPEQVRRMRAQEQAASQLYGPSVEPNSTSSSEVQAEVQRQLREYVQRYEEMTTSLRGQLEQVQRERDELLALQHGVPTGDRASLQHGVPPGDRASTQHGVPAGDRASLQHGVPPGDRASTQHGVPAGDRASTQHGVPAGDRASWQHGVAPGDRASLQHGVAPGDRASTQHGVPAGDRASTQHGVPAGDRASTQHGVPAG